MRSVRVEAIVMDGGDMKLNIGDCFRIMGKYDNGQGHKHIRVELVTPIMVTDWTEDWQQLPCNETGQSGSAYAECKPHNC